MKYDIPKGYETIFETQMEKGLREYGSNDMLRFGSSWLINEAKSELVDGTVYLQAANKKNYNDNVAKAIDYLKKAMETLKE